MEDTLKFSGAMEPISQARSDYVELHAERPVIKKLQDNIPVHPANGVSVQMQSVQRDYGQLDAKRPVIHRLHDNLKMEGAVEAQSAYTASYRPGEAVRPEIKRMHSTLGLGRGDFVKESVVRADFPEHSVARPHIARPVNQLQPHDASWGAGERPAAGRRPSQKDDAAYAPSMNRARQMESHIGFGKGDAVQSMMSTVRESYGPMDGARKAKLARPPTSNRIQDGPNGGCTGRTAANNRANLELQQADAVRHAREQVAARKKHQVTDSSVPINQPGQAMESDGSLYKNSYVLPAIERCPAAVLGVEDKSGYQFTREMHNHRFYKAVDGVA